MYDRNRILARYNFAQDAKALSLTADDLLAANFAILRENSYESSSILRLR